MGTATNKQTPLTARDIVVGVVITAVLIGACLALGLSTNWVYALALLFLAGGAIVLAIRAARANSAQTDPGAAVHDDGPAGGKS